MSNSPNQKPRVAILGGGIASLATAFELTASPDWRDRFESIAVYQMGWRLGGKGASGRNPALGQRIEEHGLHVWPGFYDNAFWLMRQCYEELGRPAAAPLAGWSDAFQPQHFIVAAENVNGQWKHWGFHAPPNDRTPGDITALPTLWDYVLGGLEFMVHWIHQITAREAGGLVKFQRPHGGLLDVVAFGLQRTLAWVRLFRFSERLRDWRDERLLRSAIVGAAELSDNLRMDAAYELAKIFRRPTAPARREQDLILWLVDQAMSWVTAQLGPLASLGDQVRRLWIQLDFAHTILRGMVRDRVLDHGFDVIDGEDFVQWMRRHGASAVTLDSALMRGLHNFVFAFENADPARPNLAAGVALRLILRLTFTYKGAIMWKMQAGMGEVVFAPLYEVLRRRGVQFHFFHRVSQLELADDGKSIGRIKLARQATVTNGVYEPLLDVNGLPCWPNQPRYEQLTEGDALQQQGVDLESVWADWPDVEEITLTAGQEYDVVVLGMSLAALRHTCDQLIESSTAWQQLVERVRTIPTHASQLWFTPPLASLGWAMPSPVLTGYVAPLETWADMTQTLAHETWPSGDRPGSVAYFCCAAPDDGPLLQPGPSPFPEEQATAVRDALLAALGLHTRPLFPSACVGSTGAIDWMKLHDPAGGIEQARLDSQFWRANVQPSDRYVQSLAGTTRFRLPPDQSGFRNLFLSGDWTRNGLNVGCIEAAVISGRRAARAMLGDRRPVVGEVD